MTRKYTNRLYEAMDEGLLLPEDIVTMCLKYMSEDDVEDMCQINCLDDLFPEEEDEEDEDDDWISFLPDDE